MIVLCYLLVTVIGQATQMVKSELIGENDESPESLNRVYQEIFRNYNKYIRPVNHSRIPVTVKISPSISGIIKANELEQSIKFFQWLPMHEVLHKSFPTWRDAHLHWNPADHGGIKYFLVPSKHIWIPDIFAFNTMDVVETMPVGKLFARVEHDGTIYMIKHQLITVNCQYKLQNFPFDVQHCVLPFGSWAYMIDHVLVEPFTTKLQEEIYQENSEWQMVSFRPLKVHIAKYGSFGGMMNRTFQEVHYELVFKRKPAFYIYILVLPCAIIVNICLIGLFVPFNTKGERQEKVRVEDENF